MIKDFIRSLLENFDVGRSAAHSFRDYHTVGVDYLNLAFGQDFVAKLYFFDHRRLKSVGPSGCVVNPHNHLYDFRTYVLSGHMTNVQFRPTWPDSKGAEQYHEFRYFSPLRNGNKRESEYGGKVWVGPPVFGRTLEKGDSYALDSTEVHSISVPHYTDTVLALLQYRDKERDFTSLFLKEPHLPSLEGLYGRFTSDQILTLKDRALKLCND